jgi:hypothetical protein
MGRSKYFDDENERDSHRKNKPKHSRNKPGQGMRVINSYVEEDDYDPFDDDIGVEDKIYITHTHGTDTK